MTHEQLTALGQAWGGYHWQSSLAHELKINPRTMRRWSAGQLPINDGAAQAILEHCKRRITDIQAVFSNIA